MVSSDVRWFRLPFKGNSLQLLLGMVWFSAERPTAAVRRQGDCYRCRHSFMMLLDPEPSLTVPEEFEQEP